MSSDDVTIVFAPRPKVEEDLRTRRIKYQVVANVEPNVTAKATISTPFKSPFVQATLFCEEPTAKVLVTDICNSKVAVSITSAASCVATVFVTIEEADGSIFKSAVHGKSVLDSSPSRYVQNPGQ